ncbi:MAG: helix-turn-helix domain-containing protein [Chloroflexi bacterium]|nr:MAG: helix-turn-helix domain-containing protein [Chloroflexota bacterium]
MSENTEWVSLRHAAELLGVHPATVRNWADKGDLPYRRTQGGHRRFDKAVLLQLAEQQGELQPVEVQVMIQNALGQTRMQIGGGNLAGVAWYNAMSDATRDELRQQGLEVLEALRAYLANGARDVDLSKAIAMGQHYAARLSTDGLTLPQAVRGFFYFSDFVINSVLVWSELKTPRNTSEWGGLLRQVNTFINTMLLSIIEYYEDD